MPDRRGSFRYRLHGVPVVVGWQSIADHGPGSAAGGPGRIWGTRPDGRIGGGLNDPRLRDSAAPSVPNLESMERHPGLLMDISQTGLCVVLDQPAPADRRLWVGFPDSGAVSWVEVILRSLSAARTDAFQLRLSFATGCPYEVFSALVLKPSLRRQSAGCGDS